MMEDARKRKFDVLLVWKLDRLGRSLKDLINTLDELGALGIDFISYENQLFRILPARGFRSMAKGRKRNCGPRKTRMRGVSFGRGGVRIR